MLKGVASQDWSVGGFRIKPSELAIATGAIMVLELALPIVTLQVYQRVIPNGSSGTLAILMAGATLAICCEFALKYTRARLMALAGFAFAHNLGRKALANVLNSDLSRLPKSSIAQRLGAMAAISSLRDFNSGFATATLLDLLLTPVLIVLIALIAGPLALVPLLLLVLFAAIAFYNGRLLSQAMDARNDIDQTRHDFIIQKLQASHTLKALSLETRMLRNYETLKFRAGLKNHEVALALTRIFDTSAFFGSVIIYLTVAFGSALVLGEQMTPGALIACILLSGRVMQPVQRAIALFARWQDHKLATAQVSKLMTPAPLQSEVSEAEAPPPNEGRLEIRNLHFGFADAPELFTGLSLSVSPGETVLLTGEPGSGRTTLLQIMAGMYRPLSGEVLVNGRPASDYASRDLSQFVGYLPNRGEIYRGSIMDNMSRFGDTSLEDVMYVARLLGVDTDVARLPGGFETPLQGSSADPIPPGLKQRIALVRALARRPKLLLFDGADAALDRASYDKVYRLFAQLSGRVTLILVTEDQYLRELATRHLDVRDRTIEEQAANRANVVRLRRYREIRV